MRRAQFVAVVASPGAYRHALLPDHVTLWVSVTTIFSVTLVAAKFSCDKCALFTGVPVTGEWWAPIDARLHALHADYLTHRLVSDAYQLLLSHHFALSSADAVSLYLHSFLVSQGLVCVEVSRAGSVMPGIYAWPHI